VLTVDPSNVDARAERGWVFARVGVAANDTAVTARGLSDLEAALAGNPQHPQALVYRAFTRMFGYNDAAGAKASLDAFDALPDRPAELVELIDEYGLRKSISDAGGR